MNARTPGWGERGVTDANERSTDKVWGVERERWHLADDGRHPGWPEDCERPNCAAYRRSEGEDVSGDEDDLSCPGCGGDTQISRSIPPDPYLCEDCDPQLQDEAPDDTDAPAYYVLGRKYEPHLVIEDWGLNFNAGSVLKYIARYLRKGDPIKDLRKARQYLDFEIERLEGS